MNLNNIVKLVYLLLTYAILAIIEGDLLMEEKSGVVYILTNPSFPEYVKIGYADNVNARLAQLNRSECVPFAFRIYATYGVSSRLSDKKIHSIIDKLNPDLRAIESFEGKKRVREFYAMTPEDAFDLLKSIAELNGLEKNLKKIIPNQNEIEEEKESSEIRNAYVRSRKKLTFAEYEIPIGSELVYTKNPDIRCKVISDTKVEYQGKQYSLSALAGKLNLESGSKNIHVAGTDVFTYKGEILSTELRTRLGI